MNAWLPLLPVLLPIGGGLLCLLARGRGISLILATSLVTTLAASIALMLKVDAHGMLVVQAGNWAPVLGISFAVDRLGAALVAVGTLVTLAGVAVDLLGGGDDEQRDPVFGASMLFLLAGVNGAFSTGDLFNLYVWFEVLLVSSFVLLTRRGRPAEARGGIPYVVLNLVGSAAFLLAVGILYGRTGTLNLAEMSLRLDELGADVAMPAAALLLVAFGMKAGVAPFFLWLPPAYPAPSPVVSAVFSGLLTKVGVYALLRASTLLFPGVVTDLKDELVAGAAVTMVVGVMAAAGQSRIRDILGFHIVSQIGYLVWGVALATTGAIAGTVFYLVHHIVVKANLFLVGGLVARATGSEDLARTGGLWRREPLLAVAFLVPALSLAGLPPLSGFWAKFALIRAGAFSEAWISTAMALGVGFLTLYSMTKIWQEAFWKEPTEETSSRRAPLPRRMLVPSLALAVITVGIGIAGGPIYAYAERSAAELLDPTSYRVAVLGPGHLEGRP